MIRYITFVAVCCWAIHGVPVLYACAPDEQSPVTEQIEKLDQQIAELDIRQSKLLEDARKLRLVATDQDREWKDLMGQIDRIKAQQESLQRQREQAEKMAAAKQTAEQTLMEAEVAFEAAKKKLEEAKQSLDKAGKEAQAATEKQAELEKLVHLSQTQLPTLESQSTAAETASNSLHQQIESLERQSIEIAGKKQQHRREIQDLLTASGQWISFSDQIAPIFQSRCVPCHNVRNSQGRYNMATYAATLSDGQAGPAILPGDAAASDLYSYIVDGWMPFEADPLDPQQIDLIRQWIDQGARLDISADANAPLLRLMPRVPQPTPPETYAASIPVTALAIDPKGETLASSGYHEVLLWALSDSRLVRRISNLAQRIYGLDFHPHTNLLAVASGTPGKIGEVKLFDSLTGELYADLAISEDVAFDVAFSPDGNRLAAVAADASVTIFSIGAPVDGTLQQHPLRIDDHADWVNSIAWSPDGSKLVTASRDKTCKVFDAGTGELLVTFSNHQASVNTAIFSSDGKRVISGGDDQRVRVWDVDDAKQQREIGGFSGPVSEISNLSNNEILAADNKGRLRQLGLADGKELKSLAPSEAWISALTQTPDHRTGFVGNHDGMIFEIGLDDLSTRRNWQSAPPER